MAKTKTAFICSECGAEHIKWQGQCSDCGNWNCLVESLITKTSVRQVPNARLQGYSGALSSVQTLDQINLSSIPRIHTGSQELDRVLGGGLVPGSAILVGGHPGAGKSTLLLQILCDLAERMPAHYVTGEESLQQVALRAQRLGLPDKKLQLLSETSVESICQTAQQLKPKILVADSIQVMHVEDIQSAPGGVAQVRESAAYLTRYAKQTNTALFLIGHVTKDGTLAGPKVLEHMIDCSIMLEGNNDSRFRTLRGQKNRFGAVNELGVFAMTEKGLLEVKNPSAIFLSRSEEVSAGSLVMVIWEGTRPLLVEIQALVDETQLSYPSRVAVCLDH